MRLNKIIEREYAIVETEYGCTSKDTTYETDDYRIVFKETVKAGTLPEAVTDCIKDNAEYSPDENVDVWRGAVAGIVTEAVTIYVPETWN